MMIWRWPLSIAQQMPSMPRLMCDTVASLDARHSAMLRELNVVEQRYQAVLEVLDDIPVTEVAERFGVTRQTVHRWVARYREDGLAGLADRSHAPKAHPWRVSAEAEAMICDLRSHRRARRLPDHRRDRHHRHRGPDHQPRHQTAQGIELRLTTGRPAEPGIGRWAVLSHSAAKFVDCERKWSYADCSGNQGADRGAGREGTP
jgi:transposase-like protein